MLSRKVPHVSRRAPHVSRKVPHVSRKLSRKSPAYVPGRFSETKPPMEDSGSWFDRKQQNPRKNGA